MDDFWKAALGVLGQVAPGIASCIGGPLAGVAVGALVTALGLPADTAPQDVASAVVKADPQALLALKQADQQFAKDMRALDIDLEKVNAGDRDSARKRQVDLHDRTPAWIGAGILLVWAGVQSFVISRGLPPGLSEAIATRIMGMLDAGAMGVIYFYFGSSNSNQRAKP